MKRILHKLRLQGIWNNRIPKEFGEFKENVVNINFNKKNHLPLEKLADELDQKWETLFHTIENESKDAEE